MALRNRKKNLCETYVGKMSSVSPEQFSLFSCRISQLHGLASLLTCHLIACDVLVLAYRIDHVCGAQWTCGHRYTCIQHVLILVIISPTWEYSHNFMSVFCSSGLSDTRIVCVRRCENGFPRDVFQSDFQFEMLKQVLKS